MSYVANPSIQNQKSRSNQDSRFSLRGVAKVDWIQFGWLAGKGRNPRDHRAGSRQLWWRSRRPNRWLDWIIQTRLTISVYALCVDDPEKYWCNLWIIHKRGKFKNHRSFWNSLNNFNPGLLFFWLFLVWITPIGCVAERGKGGKIAEWTLAAGDLLLLPKVENELFGEGVVWFERECFPPKFEPGDVPAEASESLQ